VFSSVDGSDQLPDDYVNDYSSFVAFYDVNFFTVNDNGPINDCAIVVAQSKFNLLPF
jgi:hypothetical protein